MISLTALHALLSQILSLPDLHSAILFSPSGQLVSAAYDPYRPKDEILVVVGLSGEIWQETQEQGFGMVDSEMGRILVIPVQDIQLTEVESRTKPPLMLLVLNSTDAIPWDELKAKGKILSGHLAKTLSKFREHLAVPVATKPLSPGSAVSPARLAR